MKHSNRGFLFNVVLPTLLIASFGVFITATVHRMNGDESGHATEAVTSNIADDIWSEFASQIRVLNGIRAFWLSSQEVTPEEFSNYAAIVFEDAGPIIALQWVDPQNIVRYVYPLEGENLKVVDFDNNKFPNRLKPILLAKELRQPVMTRPIFLAQGFPGVVIYVPIFRGEEYLGAAVGVMRLSELFREFRTMPYKDYDILVAAEGFVLRADGNVLYDMDGNRVTSPAGDAVPDPDAPRLPADFERRSVPVFIGDQVLRASATPHSDEFPAFTLALILITAAITALCAAFLTALDRTHAKLQLTSARELDFASLVSHQLRAPLTELNWMVDVLDEPETDQKARTATVADMRHIVRQSVRLITELLSISRIERNVVQIKAEDSPIATMIDDVLMPLRETAKEKKVTFRINVPPALTAHVDATKAVEAIRNVVDNAIKYGPEHGVIDIDAHRAGDVVTLTVHDLGPGIPPDIKDRVFDKASAFAKKGTTDGAGLGLYLSKMLIELMGGSIGFDTSPGGTTFTITMPSSAKKAEQRRSAAL